MLTLKRVTCIVLSGTTLACTSVRPVLSPSTFIPERRPEVVWVNDPDQGEVFTLANPTMQGDTVLGTMAGMSEPMALPLKPQYTVLARQRDGGKTAQLVVAVGVITGLAIWGFVVGGSGPRRCTTPGYRGCPG
jgi:hypothetical protein